MAVSCRVATPLSRRSVARRCRLSWLNKRQFHNIPEAPAQDAIFEQSSNGYRSLILNRPNANHAININVIKLLGTHLRAVEADPQMIVSTLKHIEDTPGFSYGDDWKRLASSCNNPNSDLPTQYFRSLSNLNYFISQLTKPFIPFMNGTTRGGAYSIAALSNYRVCSENTEISHPQTGMGFVPHGGASYYLPRLDGHLGMYLALTGAPVKSFDAYHSGLATHVILEAWFHDLQERLMDGWGGIEFVENTLDSFHSVSENALIGYFDKYSFEGKFDVIDSCFSRDSVEDIMEGLRANDSEFAQDTLKQLLLKSPTSLKVTHRLMKEGAEKPLADCLQMEYRVVQNMMRHKDFYTGLSAYFSKQGGEVNWSPNSLDAVEDGDVNAIFRRPLVAQGALINELDSSGREGPLLDDLVLNEPTPFREPTFWFDEP